MSAIIRLSHLKKYFKVHQRSSGIFSQFGSIFYRRFNEVKAVDDISFKINEGELIGFIGPNGAGKTTTLKCLSGLIYPTEGEISVLDFVPFQRKNDFLKKISLVAGQKNQLWWDLPAIDTFRLNKEIYDIDDKSYEKVLDQLTDLLEVKDLLKISVRHLSLGQRMKMELIAALLHSPKVLFLDEPTIGLDVVMQKKIRDFIGEYNRKFKATILLTSHYMTDVKQLCKRVIILDHGKIIYDGDLEKLVKLYADHKIISAIFKKEVEAEKIARFGQIKFFQPPKLTLIVPRNTSQKIAVDFLKEFPVEDFNIEDPQIEDIIRRVFNKSKNEKILVSSQK